MHQRLFVLPCHRWPGSGVDRVSSSAHDAQIVSNLRYYFRVKNACSCSNAEETFTVRGGRVGLTSISRNVRISCIDRRGCGRGFPPKHRWSSSDVLVVLEHACAASCLPSRRGGHKTSRSSNQHLCACCEMHAFRWCTSTFCQARLSFRGTSETPPTRVVKSWHPETQLTGPYLSRTTIRRSRHGETRCELCREGFRKMHEPVASTWIGT